MNDFRKKVHEVIFEADTPAGKFFDVVLLIAIVLSVLVVMLESVPAIDAQIHEYLFYSEWILTILFTIEYGLRLYSVGKPMKYASSFYGVVDLLSILPTYLSLILAGTHYFMVIRALRLLRVFRIFKLAHFINEGTTIVTALKKSRTKIIVFLFFVLLLVTIIGSIMYLVEGNQNSGYSSIPRSIYWAIVTLTTVGYGDISPVTPLGQFLSAIVMMLGYAVLAVPTGIVSAEFVSSKKTITTQSCPSCGAEGHDPDAVYCKFCSELLNN